MGLLRVTEFRNYQVNKRKLIQIYYCALNLQLFLGFESASIITVDSDVAILSIYHQHRLDVKLFLRIGTVSKEKIFDIHTNDLSIDVVDALCMLYQVATPPALLVV